MTELPVESSNSACQVQVERRPLFGAFFTMSSEKGCTPLSSVNVPEMWNSYGVPTTLDPTIKPGVHLPSPGGRATVTSPSPVQCIGTTSPLVGSAVAGVTTETNAANETAAATS